MYVLSHVKSLSTLSCEQFHVVFIQLRVNVRVRVPRLPSRLWRPEAATQDGAGQYRELDHSSEAGRRLARLAGRQQATGQCAAARPSAQLRRL